MAENNRFPEPAEAKRFLERKLNVKTEAWDELKWGEHSHAFTVAHSVGANVLDDIHGLINKAMANGESLETFRAGMLETMAKTGWYGKAGKTAEDESYINWRIKVIYETNMRTAYSASRYREQLAGARTRPIWVYLSKMHGKNRRPEHILLHNKAFRYDDPFWDTHYPPNGWGCQCRVTTKSEHGVARDGVEILRSDADGNPPKISGMDWDAFDPTWQYNPGRELLAPNFGKFENLKEYPASKDAKPVLNQVMARYQQDMNKTRMTQGEFTTLLRRMDKQETKIQAINYQIGNLAEPQHQALVNVGVMDSKIMAMANQLGHGSGNKNAEQKVPAELYGALYQTIQEPEAIYENTAPDNPRHGREFHFVKKTKGGKILNVVLRLKDITTALQLITMGWIPDMHESGGFKKIW